VENLVVKHSVSIPCRLAAIPLQGIVLRPEFRADGDPLQWRFSEF
jgi:hypothetical protein